jgi:thiol oxidase
MLHARIATGLRLRCACGLRPPPLHPAIAAQSGAPRLVVSMALASPSLAADVCVLATPAGAAPCALASGAWLAAAPRGAYTSARTVGGTSVFELSFHIDRLATSARLMMAADEAEGRPGTAGAARRHAALADPAALRPAVLRSLRAALTAFRAANGGAPAEAKLTVLVTWGPEGGQVSTHAQDLGPRPPPPVKVVVRGAPRANAAAKDSEWVRARRQYEAQQPSDANETLLADAGGAIFEGLSSNFLVLAGGALHTAGEGVLLGSVREAVLRVAAAQGVPVVLAPPRLGDLATWEAAFVSSTSRLLLPVAVLEAPEEAPPLRRVFERSPLAEALEAGVVAEVAACSEPVFE